MVVESVDPDRRKEHLTRSLREYKTVFETGMAATEMCVRNLVRENIRDTTYRDLYGQSGRYSGAGEPSHSGYRRKRRKDGPTKQREASGIQPKRVVK